MELFVPQLHFTQMFAASCRGKREAFTREEDTKLYMLASSYGTENLGGIAETMWWRTRRELKERLQHYIEPNLYASQWTRDEDELLERKYAEIGPRWTAISQFFANRTDVMVKNRHYQLARARRNSPIQVFEIDSEGNYVELNDDDEMLTESLFDLVLEYFDDESEFDETG
jgi:hypothetical protein